MISPFASARLAVLSIVRSTRHGRGHNSSMTAARSSGCSDVVRCPPVRTRISTPYSSNRSLALHDLLWLEWIALAAHEVERKQIPPRPETRGATSLQICRTCSSAASPGQWTTRALNSSIANALGMPGMSVYGATKAAVRSLTRNSSYVAGAELVADGGMTQG